MSTSNDSTLTLGIPGFSYADLHSPAGLARLHAAFEHELQRQHLGLWDEYHLYRNGASLEPPQLSDLLVRLGAQVGDFLARLFGVRATEVSIEEFGTVLSQIGDAAFGGGIGFWVLQVFTAAILVLAANTAYQDFPRLSAILAGRRLMPRQYRNRGDRLVFSNGIITLAVLAVILLFVFDASVTRLVQLYVVDPQQHLGLDDDIAVRRHRHGHLAAHVVGAAEPDRG